MSSRSIWICSGATAIAVMACTVDDEAGRAAASGGRTVALVTGDRVTLTDGEPVVTRGRDRGNVSFAIVRNGPHVMVVPSDAAPRIARGELAPAQFAVTGSAEPSPPSAAASYDVALHVLDNTGAPGEGFFFLSRGAEAPQFHVLEPDMVLHLEAGQYALDASVGSPDGERAMLVIPRLDVHADARITLDARTAIQPRVTLPGPPRAVLGSTGSYADAVTGHHFATLAVGLLAIGQIGPDLPADELLASATITLSDRDTAPTELTQLAHGERGHQVRAWNEAIEPGQLATVSADHAGTGNELADKRVFAYSEDGELLGGGLDVFQETPFAVTERYDARVRWLAELEANDAFGPARTTTRQLRRYAGGQRYVEHWNRAPFGPALPDRVAFGPDGVDLTSSARRDGDTLRLQPALFAAQGGRDQGSICDERSTLTRDGEVIADVTVAKDDTFPAVDVPPGPATYRLTQRATRSDVALSPRASATWTFRSRHGDAILPLPAVRFEPLLDEHNTSHARVLALPIRVERPAGAPRPAITELRVEASFDDGATWTRVPVLGGERAIALLVHPAGAQAVSLRAMAADARGNRVEQETIRAYLVSR